MQTESAAQYARPAIWMILIAAVLDMMAMGIVMPVLPVLIEDLTGSTASAAIWTGMVAALWGAMQFLCAPVIGALSDHYGRRRVILISTVGLALDWVLMALAPSLWWLVVGRIIGGATSASGTALFAYMADITPPEGRARAFGILGAAVSAGFVAGPALGGVLGELGPRVPFWVAAGLSGAAFLYGLFVLPESLPPHKRTGFSWRRASPLGALMLLRSHTELTGLAVSTFLLTFTHRIFTAIFVLYAGHRYGMSTLEVGLLLAASGLVDLFMQGFVVGKATARFGDRRVMLVGLWGGATGLLAMGLAPTGLLFALAMLPNALWGLAEPTLKAMMSARVAEEEQGRLQGATHCVISLAGMVGSVFFGWTYALSAAEAPGFSFFAAAALLVLATVTAGIGKVSRA